MTDLATERPAYTPTGRPVRRFVVALGVLAVTFGALWWSGLVTPRVDAGSTGAVQNNLNGRVSLHLRLSNNTPLAVEIRGVALGDKAVPPDSMRMDGRDISANGWTLAASSETAIDIELTCRSTPPAPQPDPRGLEIAEWTSVGLEIAVVTPIGLERTRSFGSFSAPRACLRDPTNHG